MPDIDPDAYCREVQSLVSRAMERHRLETVESVAEIHGLTAAYLRNVRRWEPESGTSFTLHKLAVARAVAEKLLEMEPTVQGPRPDTRRKGYRAPRSAPSGVPRAGGYGEILDHNQLVLLVRDAVRDALSLAGRLEIGEALEASDYSVSYGALYTLSRWTPSTGRTFTYRVLEDAFHFSVGFIEAKTKGAQ